GRLDEVPGRDEVTLVVDTDRQLWQRPVCRTENNLGRVRRIERGLVTRAQDAVRRTFVQCRRAPHMGADLRVGDDAVVRPVDAGLVTALLLVLLGVLGHARLPVLFRYLDQQDHVFGLVVHA